MQLRRVDLKSCGFRVGVPALQHQTYRVYANVDYNSFRVDDVQVMVSFFRDILVHDFHGLIFSGAFQYR